METRYQVVLVSEDGKYPQEDFQTYDSACQYCADNQYRYGEDRELVVEPIYRRF